MADDEAVSQGRTRGEWLALAAKVAFAVVGLALVVAELGALSSSLSGAPARPDAKPASLRLPTPPLLADSGTRITSQLLETGAVQVTQWIRDDDPISTLTLTRLTAAGSSAQVGEVVVGSGDQVVSRFGHLGATERVVPLGGPTELAYVSYVITGAVQPATGQRPSTVQVTGVDVGYRPRVGPQQVVVPGSSVTRLVCTAAGAGARPLPCGRVVDGQWAVVLRGDARGDLVSAELASGGG